MNFVLVVFVTFHFDAGATSATVPFASRALCEAARHKILTEQTTRPDGWGRSRLLAFCVETS